MSCVFKKLLKKKDPYRPAYHFTVQSGWINDPNGFVRFKGKYHVFAQHYAPEPKWGPMTWAHATSDDMILFHREPDAIKPDQPYDKGFGCFSGSAIEKDGKLWLMYTGVADDKQRQCLAYSEDGINFTKYEGNPVIDERQLPQGYLIKDFRDPKVFERDGSYWCLTAARRDDGYSSVLLFKSPDLFSWSYVGRVLESEDVHSMMLECPNFENVEGKDVLFVSAQICTDPAPFNRFCTYAFVGKLNMETGKFETEFKRRLDYGFDSYATQTVKTPDGRTLLVSWMSAWGSTFPTQKYGWCGQFTLPREVFFRNGNLDMLPARELSEHETENLGHSDNIGEIKKILGRKHGRFVDLSLTLNRSALDASVSLCCGKDKLVISIERERLRIDRSHCENKINTESRPEDYVRYLPLKGTAYNKVRIIIDASLIEIFADKGRYDACACFYPSHKINWTVKLDGFKDGNISLDELHHSK